MEENKLELLEREFDLFESKIKEVKKLKTVLNSLDTEGFEDHVEVIEKEIFNVDNILKIKKLIDNLKLKIEKREIESKSKLVQLLEQVFECNDNVNVWSLERLSKEYLSIYTKYNTFPKKEKAIVYSTIVKLYKKIQQR